MFRHTLAIVAAAATTVPALAAHNVVASHEVRFDQVSFVCGEKNNSGKVIRYMRSIPGAKFIPENELPPSDPLAKSWDITYRIICESAQTQTELLAKDYERAVR